METSGVLDNNVLLGLRNSSVPRNFFRGRPPEVGMDTEELTLKTFENVPYVMAARTV
jgi:hypothetical protein